MNAPRQMLAADAKALIGEAAVSELARHALWRQGDLSWMYHRGRAPAHNGQVKLDAMIADAYARGVRRFVANIGRRFGKSHYFVLRAAQKCLRKPRSRIPYAASTGVSLMQFILPIAREIGDTAPADLRPELVDFEWRFHNESVVVFQGCEDMAKANRLRGPAADEAVVDEAAFIPVLMYVVRSVLNYQLGTTDGMMLVGSTPPETPAHPFTALAAEAQARGAYMHATIHDSPFVTKAAAAKLCEEAGGVTSSAWRREALAEFVVDETRALVPEFSQHETEIVVDDYARPFEYDRYTVSDVGFIDLTASLFASYDFANAIVYVENEYFAERATSKSIAAAHKRIEAETWSEPLGPFAQHQVWVDAQAITRADLGEAEWCDNAPPGDEQGHVDRLKTMGFTPRRYHRQVNTKEPEEAVNQLRVNIAKRIRIHKRCTHLIAHLRHGIWNEQRTSFARSEGLGHFDGVAALMYLWRHVDRNHNPATPFIQSQVTHFVPAHQRVPYFASEAQRNAAHLGEIFKAKRKRA